MPHRRARSGAGRSRVPRIVIVAFTLDPTISWNELLQHASATPIESFQPGVARLPAPLARMILSTPGSTGDPAATRARL
jgi:hypothetical protein